MKKKNPKKEEMTLDKLAGIMASSFGGFEKRFSGRFDDVDKKIK